MSTDVLYELHALRQVRGERTTLDIEAQTIKQGKCYGLLGKNGAGKTTLLKILAFLEHPYQGKIIFHGQEVSSHNCPQMRRQVVWLSQLPLLFSGTVLYNVCYPLRLKGISRKEAVDIADRLIADAGLTHLRKAHSSTLSGGEAQRTCIVRALATGAKVLLLDEPTSGLDADAQTALRDHIRALIGNPEYTLILTSHDAGFLAPLCEEKIYLEQGRVVNAKTAYYQGELTVSNNAPLLTLKDKINLSGFWKISGLSSIENGIMLSLCSVNSPEIQVLLKTPDSIEEAQKLHLHQSLPIS